jgi:hypothetical protein
METPPKKRKPFAIARNKEADDFLNKAIYVIAAATVLVALVVGYQLWKSSTQPEMIKAVVYLDNRCQIMDDAFMVYAEPNGASSHFTNGKAEILLPANGRLIVKSSPRFPAFKYETHKHQVLQPYTVITASCGDHIDKTLDAMREQFRKRE